MQNNLENSMLIVKFMDFYIDVNISKDIPVREWRTLKSNKGFEYMSEYVMLDSSNIEEMRKIRDVHMWYMLAKESHYHKSWNELMGVVDKIENIVEDWQPQNTTCSYSVSISNSGCEIRSSISLGGKDVYHNIEQSGNKFNSTYKAIIEFINWYNQK